MAAMIANLSEQVRQLPEDPGVYIMKDERGAILYVGKAARLRHRVKSYFSGSSRLDWKTKKLVSNIADLEFFVTGSEQEALILELNLIKRHHPPYNLELKDDKTFPYLKIDLSEEWPRVMVTRRLEAGKKIRYFGPFASARSIRQTLRVIKEIFPFRSCSEKIDGRRQRPCLEYDIHQCVAPCVDATLKAEYDAVIRQLILFMEGKQEKVVKELKKKMQAASKAMEYEKAGILRDQIQAVKRVVEAQKIAARVRGEQDVVAFAREKDQTYVQVFFIRGGKMIGRDSFILKGTEAAKPQRIMADFLEQFYATATHIPSLILLQNATEDRAVIEEWLSGKRNSRVRLLVPQRGGKKELVGIAAKNAKKGLEQFKIKQLPSPANLKKALEEIQQKLGLPSLPSRMEGYDISNIQGRDAVGSMVVFTDGKPDSSHYRRFRIKTVLAADDYAMLKEVVSRRFGRFKENTASNSWSIRPDLVLIDGGKGQLSAASEAMHETGAADVPLASLAKENEELFRPGRGSAIRLPLSSPGLRLLQHLRDEAHRFALGYHHKLRRRQIGSALDDVPGIGPVRRRQLIKEFGSVSAIRHAQEEALARAKGMNAALARKIKELL